MFMAKYNVVFACGHEEEIQLYGPHENRDKMIDYLQENGKCSACKREQKELLLLPLDRHYACKLSHILTETSAKFYIEKK